MSERRVLGVKVVGNIVVILGLLILASWADGERPAIGIVLLVGAGGYAVGSSLRLMPQVRESNSQVRGGR